MSIYNYLEITTPCPWCGVRSTVDAQIHFGLRDLIHYRVGDTLRWEGRGVRTPRHRPDGGNHVGEGYAECPACGRDYFLDVRIENDVIASFEVDTSRPGYIRQAVDQEG